MWRGLAVDLWQKSFAFNTLKFTLQARLKPWQGRYLSAIYQAKGVAFCNNMHLIKD